MSKRQALLGCITLLCAANVHGQNAEHQIVASQFGEFQVPSVGNGFAFPAASCQVSGGGKNFDAFSAGAPIKIVDIQPSKVEVVTPVAVFIQSCAVSLPAVYQHTSFYLTSGTGGLQEAILNGQVHGGPNTIVLDTEWYALIQPRSAATVIGTVTGSALLGLVDVTTTPYQSYTWNGTQYIAVTAGGGGAPNGPASGALGGTYPAPTVVGAINPSSTGATTPGTGAFTTLAASGGITATPDGVHAGYLNLVGNTANPALGANTAGFLGPNIAAFTAYALQLPSAGPSVASALCASSLAGGVSMLSFCSPGTAGAVALAPTTSQSIVQPASTTLCVNNQGNIFYAACYAASGAHTAYDEARIAADAYAAANPGVGSVLTLAPGINATCDAAPLPAISGQLGTTSILGYGSNVSTLQKQTGCAASAATLKHPDATARLSSGKYTGFTVDANHIDTAACEFSGMQQVVFEDMNCGNAASGADHEWQMGDANSGGAMENIYGHDLTTFDSVGNGKNGAFSLTFTGTTLTSVAVTNGGSPTYSQFVKATLIGPGVLNCSTLPAITPTINHTTTVTYANVGTVNYGALSGATITNAGNCSSTAGLYVMIQDGLPAASGLKLVSNADSYYSNLLLIGAYQKALDVEAGSLNNTFAGVHPYTNATVELYDVTAGNRYYSFEFDGAGQYAAQLAGTLGLIDGATFTWDSPTAYAGSSGFYFSATGPSYVDWKIRNTQCSNTQTGFTLASGSTGPYSSANGIAGGVKLQNAEVCDGTANRFDNFQYQQVFTRDQQNFYESQLQSGTDLQDVFLNSGVSVPFTRQFSAYQAATSSSAQTNSPTLQLVGQYWNGTASTQAAESMGVVFNGAARYFQFYGAGALTYLFDGPIAGTSLSLSGLTAGSSPVCPNGAGGTLTTAGCVTGSMVYPAAGVANSTGSAWGTSYTVGTAASNLVQLNASAQLPAVDASQTTNLNAGALASGTVAAARMPALTGDCTTTAGAVATTCTKTNGTALGTAATQNTGTTGATIPLNNGANTESGAATFSAAGAASAPGLTITGAPYTGGTATSDFPQFYLNAGAAVSTFSTAGTMFGVNAPSGFSGHLLNLFVHGGSTRFRVDSAGDLFAAGTTTLASNLGLSSTAAPTMAAGAAAGTAPTCATVTGNNNSMVVTCTTGTATTASATLATITFNGTLGTTPNGCSLTARNAASVLSSADVYTTAPSTTSFTIAVAGTALAASTSFSWSVACL